MTSNAPLVNGFDIPTDSTHPLEPNRALAIRLPAPHATHRPSEIHDLTPRLQTLFSTASGITDENLLSAHKASIVSPPPQIRYSLERQNLLGTHLAILDVEGNEIANWKHPILSLGVGSGTTEITFPREGEKPTKIEIKKVVDSKGKEKTGYLHHHHVQNFILDGVRYFWKEEAGVIYQKALFKVVEDETIGQVRREVARYAQRSSHEREGLLVLNGREVDELIVVLTICAMLEAKESFLH